MDNPNEAINSKPLFRFKQFSLTDAGCAMKIGTDGLLLGAYGAKIASEGAEIAHVLDVGTGCGIVALMTTQKCNAQIHAIDKDPEACARALINFKNSPWSDRLNCFQTPLQHFVPPDDILYDLILCNPPYFQDSLQSPDLIRSIARHNHSLDFAELFHYGRQLLSSRGVLIIIYPFDLMPKVSSLAQANRMYEMVRIKISASYNSKTIRVISQYSVTQHESLQVSQMSIETSKRHQFSDAYKELTRDFHPFLR
jgi:tRNA1Val (adenine37-N6)-methyltransferase